MKKENPRPSCTSDPFLAPYTTYTFLRHLLHSLVPSFTRFFHSIFQGVRTWLSALGLAFIPSHISPLRIPCLYIRVSTIVLLSTLCLSLSLSLYFRFPPPLPLTVQRRSDLASSQRA